jgi:hypothetical protein
VPGSPRQQAEGLLERRHAVSGRRQPTEPPTRLVAPHTRPRAPRRRQRSAAPGTRRAHFAVLFAGRGGVSEANLSVTTTPPSPPRPDVPESPKDTDNDGIPDSRDFNPTTPENRRSRPRRGHHARRPLAP